MVRRMPCARTRALANKGLTLSRIGCSGPGALGLHLELRVGIVIAQQKREPLGRRVNYPANISWRMPRELEIAVELSLPSLLTSLWVSTVRSWSSTTNPSFFWNRQLTRKG